MVGIIDDKDRKILDILKDHGDFTTRQIAKKTLLPPTTINNRVRRMKKEGIIRRFTIEPDYDSVGKGQLVYVLVSANLLELKKQKRSQYDIVRELKKYDFVERADVVSGGTDIVLMVRVKDVKEYDSVLLSKIQMVEGIDKTTSLMVIH